MGRAGTDDANPGASRRGFLQAGVAAGAIPAVAAVSSAWPGGALAAESETVRFYKVIHDQDHPAALAFAAAARAQGMRTVAVDGDVTALWYHDLYHRWLRGPAPIAGLTRASAAFCLEVLGRDAGMRMVYRAEHNRAADGGLEHRLWGPASMIARASLLDTGDAWGAGTAKLIGRCPAARTAKAEIALSCAPATTAMAAEPLVSWVIAPVSRA